MSPDLFFQYLFAGITYGAIYAVVAIGFNIIYNATGIINFAQGEFVMLPAFFVLAGLGLGFGLWPSILLGLVLALDVLGAASGLGAAGQWREIGAGVGYALAASATFGLALVLTQHEAGGLDGRLRTFATMAIVGLLAGVAVAWRGGFALPTATAGWWGLALLTLLYGTGITILFTVLPRLGVVGNSAVMNVEPVFALVLAWLILGQAIAPVQVVGALIVVGAVIWLGMRKK